MAAIIILLITALKFSVTKNYVQVLSVDFAECLLWQVTMNGVEINKNYIIDLNVELPDTKLT